MAVPDAPSELSMLKIARERTGNGYTSSVNITAPIYFSDLSRLNGGNTSGSGVSYPPVNINNPSDERPDGSDPQTFSEFFSYEQNLTRTPFKYLYDTTSSNNACASGLPSFVSYFHTDGNNLYPDALDGRYTAYKTETGTTPAEAGYYQIYNSSDVSTGKFIQVGSNGSIIGGGTC